VGCPLLLLGDPHGRLGGAVPRAGDSGAGRERGALAGLMQRTPGA